MRCIEIAREVEDLKRAGLINYNMRCIEILYHNFNHYLFKKINYNMRCIEIKRRLLTDRGKLDKLQHEMY